MDERHPSGTMTTPAPASDSTSAPYPAYGTSEAYYADFTQYDGQVSQDYGTGSYETGTQHGGGYDTGSYDTGSHPSGSYDTGGWADPSTTAPYTGDGYASTSSYDSGQWDTGTQYDGYAAQFYAEQHYAAQETGSFDTTDWGTGEQHSARIPGQAADGPDGAGEWNWNGQDSDTGSYDATAWNTAEGDDPSAHDGRDAHERESADGHRADADGSGHDGPRRHADEADDRPGFLDDQDESLPHTSRSAGRGGRRRTPARRSALLTVAVPSVCVMGVAGVAAASVGGSVEETTTQAASDAQPVKPSAANDKISAQFSEVTVAAADFGDRASREQERIDLEAQRAAELRKAAEEAAKKERLRPKFSSPVAQRGLSAYYGAAGVNWMSAHTGIDFPVAYGTPVLAATDGTVRTQFNSAYGNMMIVTAKDGTETWYCHLSTYKLADGMSVKAGDTIAYSGNSGNSTGPHLHFEVRPGGGGAVDPLAWLRSHGIDPT
ncbi:M23 family metallopeptidase [Streptomyces chilikensis]|uniref:M23 family metallopeptidase n=1 Tax=Streptomyces chilikensis TaxID=1194079 RepID=UPI00140DD139|nr:M23 family metallopeptidase [Streptomyces chilikensis]